MERKLIIGALALAGALHGVAAQAQGVVNPLTGSYFNSQPMPVQGYSQPPSQQFQSVQSQIGTPDSFHAGQFGGFAPVGNRGGNGGYVNNGGGGYSNGTYQSGGGHYNGNGGYGNGGYGNYGGYGSPYGNNYIFLPDNSGSSVVIGGTTGQSYGIVGYTYGGYPIYGFSGGTNEYAYPDAYCYPGLPAYVSYAPSDITIYSTPPSFNYVGNYVPYTDPSTQGPTYVYNQYNTYNNYIGSAPAPAAPPSGGSATPSPSAQPSALPAAAQSALPVKSADDEVVLKQAFQDISRAWIRSDISLIKKYTAATTKISVLAKSQYQYSIDADKFATTTDSVFDALFTRSFDFDALRAMQNGDITAYAKHIYELRSGAATDPLKTMYVSYTMGKRNGRWLIVAVDSSPTPLAPTQAASASTTGNVVGVTTGAATVPTGVTY